MPTIKNIALELDHTDDDCVDPHTGQMNIKRLELSVKKHADKHGVTATYLPGKEPGGHPVFRVSGPYKNMFAYMLEYCGGDKEDAKNMIEEYGEEV